jgi:4-hydroxythreonine-4-phosphate dehydrogenase
MNLTRVLITVGDPGGIGPETLQKVLQTGEIQERAQVTVLGPSRCMEHPPEGVEWVDVDLPSLRFHRRPHPDNGRVTLLTLEEACRRMGREEADVLVTGPVSKEAIRRCGVPFSGHTEFLAQAFSATTYMVFFTGSMPVALFTMHLPMNKVSEVLTRDNLTAYIRGLATSWNRQLNEKPRFRVAGFNPHAGEGGLMGREEREVIEPAVEALINEGIEVEGPFSADSLFLRHDDPSAVAVALYHDQGMIPAKMMSAGHAVNCTLGLPFLRTAPDHGPAFDIAGEGKADPESLRRAILEGLSLLGRRR